MPAVRERLHAFSWGDDINSSLANYNWDGDHNTGNDAKQTVDVGQFSPNPWGFLRHARKCLGVGLRLEGRLSSVLLRPIPRERHLVRPECQARWFVVRARLKCSMLRSAFRLQYDPPFHRYASDTGFRLAFQPMPADTANPEIILTGTAALTHSARYSFCSTLAYEAHDARDGNITDQVVVTGSIDVNSTGTYLLTYTVEDAAGNTATTATRTVTVTGNRTVDLNATVALDMIWVPSPAPLPWAVLRPLRSGRGTDETEHNVSHHPVAFTSASTR